MAGRLVEAANSGSSYTLDDAQKDRRKRAPAAEGSFDPDHKWSEARKYGGDQPLPYAALDDDFGRVAGKAPADAFTQEVEREARKIRVREAARHRCRERPHLLCLEPSLLDRRRVRRELPGWLRCWFAPRLGPIGGLWKCRVPVHLTVRRFRPRPRFGSSKSRARPTT